MAQEKKTCIFLSTQIATRNAPPAFFSSRRTPTHPPSTLRSSPVLKALLFPRPQSSIRSVPRSRPQSAPFPVPVLNPLRPPFPSSIRSVPRSRPQSAPSPPLYCSLLITLKYFKSGNPKSEFPSHTFKL